MTLRDPINGPAQGTTRANGFTASYHQQFHPWMGYKANVSWTRVDELYEGTSYQLLNGRYFPVTTLTRIPNNVVELSSTYVVQQPDHGGRWRAFGELGPGVLMFVPSDAPFAGYPSYRAAAVYGAGATVRLQKHWGLQLEYRGYFYKSPDFAAAPAPSPERSKYFTFTAGPAISVSYRFR